ncbi:PcfB family protein [Ruminococcus sp.]|uniref:PcfB family protein n=1 Tax=Ruminococcus sp. TaxID=41978 RepID=UPI0025E4D387|nr:PcfB family protein [Ruminococcus sp.]
MPGETEKDIRSIIDLVIQGKDITKELIQQAMQGFLQQDFGSNTKQGKTSLRKLSEQSSGKLESIEVSQANIKDFEATAAKYDITFAVKRDSGTNPPTHHVFFAAKDADNFKRAFTEYAANVSEKAKTRYEIPREQIQSRAAQIQKEPRQKDRVRAREQQETR